MIDVLSFASVMDYRDELSDDLAKELVERTAMTVDIFPFVRLVAATMKIEVNDFDVIPKKIRSALKESKYTDRVAREIEEMSDEAFDALLAFIMSDEVTTTHVKLNLPIIRRIYGEELIPADLMFAYMGLSLRDTIDERIHGIIPGIFGDILIGSLFSELDDDDDEEDDEDDAKKCNCDGCHGGCGDCHGCHSDN